MGLGLRTDGYEVKMIIEMFAADVDTEKDPIDKGEKLSMCRSRIGLKEDNIEELKVVMTHGKV